MKQTETDSRSPVIPSRLVALHKVFNFVFKVVPIMVNFVLCVWGIPYVDPLYREREKKSCLSKGGFVTEHFAISHSSASGNWAKSAQKRFFNMSLRTWAARLCKP